MDNEKLMYKYKETMGDALDSLKFCLQMCGFKLKAIRIYPNLSKKAKEIITNRGIDVL